MRRLRRPLLAASRWIIRMCIPFEASIIRCSRRHRLKIVGVLHPLSAVVLFSIIGFLFSYDLYYVAPKILDTGGPWYWLSVLLASFIVFNILGNWWLSFNTSTLVESLPPSGSILPGARLTCGTTASNATSWFRPGPGTASCARAAC